MPGLEIRNLTHSFGPQPVIEDLSLTIAPGEIGCLVGPSGCGKTTILSMAGGLAAPLEGEIIHSFRHPVFVFQDPCLLPWRDARDNVAFGLKARGVGRRERLVAAERLLGVVGLAPEDGAKFPHELSGGMRQRVALARALAVEPDLLLMDEPFSALDVGLRRQMQGLFRRLITERGLTALLVTHDLAEAVRLADRIFVLSPAPGRVAAVHPLTEPDTRRDDGFVHKAVGRLLADPATAGALTVEERG